MRSAHALPPAVVFDCDGTLADTETLSDRAWAESLTRHGYQPTREDFRALIGHPYRHNWAHFSTRVDLGDPDVFRSRLRARFVELFDHELELYPDAVDTVRAVASAGVAVAVASSSSHAHVVRVLERAGLVDLVRAVVGSDDVERHKPDPAPYLTAAARLEVAPRRCVAVDDTPVGVAAATAAGMFTVAVVRRHVEPAELGGADRVVERITPDVLVRPETAA